MTVFESHRVYMKFLCFSFTCDSRGFHCGEYLANVSWKWWLWPLPCPWNYIHFIRQVALVRRQRRKLLVFETSCHLSTTLDGDFTLSLFNDEHSAVKQWISIFIVFGLTRSEIETRVYRFNSRRSLYSTTGQMYFLFQEVWVGIPFNAPNYPGRWCLLEERDLLTREEKDGGQCC